MNRTLTTFAAMLLAGTSACLAQSRAAQPTLAASSPGTAVKVAYDRFILPNGLTTLVYTDRSMPNIYVGVWYRTGSKDEPPGKSGFAHLFEHLMFQQTANRKGEFLATLDAAGASGMNGSTTTDYTNYYQTVPTNALDLALWMESDRMGYLDGGITQAVLDEQRRVVQNEKRQRESPIAEAVQRQFFESYYPTGHPYAHSTIGSMADLEAATLDDVKRWFTDHYGASNAVLVLAGDIDLATAREKVTRYFGGLRAGKLFDRPTEWVPALTAVRRDVMYAEGVGGTLTRSWPVSNQDPRGVTLLLLAARTMTAVRDSAFVNELVDTAKVATNVEASLDINQLDAKFTISMALRPGVSAEQAGAALDAAVRRFVATGPSPAAVSSIMRGTDTAILRSLDSNSSVAAFLIDGEIQRGDPGFFLKQRDWALAATPGEVGAVVAKWLDRPFYEQVVLPPPGAGATRTADIDRTRMPTLGPVKTAIDLPPVTQMTLANGMKLVVAERPKIPLVDVAMRFDTGIDADAAYAPGAAVAAFELMKMGSTKAKGAQIAEQSSLLDVPLSTSVNDSSTTFQWSAGTARLDPAFALAADVLRNPVYNAALVSGAAADTERRLSGPMDAQARAETLLANAIWGNADPRGRLAQPQDYRGLTREQVARFHAHEIGPRNATLLMVGDITPARAKALAERYFGDWRPNTPAAARSLPATRQQASRIILIDAPGAAQSSITVGSVVRPFDKDADAAEQLANAVLANGSNGRLNMNLRESKGWTYGFGGGIGDAPLGDRLFVAGGGVQTDQTAPAMAEIRREVAEFVSTRPITAVELNASQSAAVRSVPLWLADAPGLLGAMTTASAYKLPYERIEGAATRLEAITLDQVQAAAKQLYSSDRLVWVVVGDLKIIEPSIRALNIAPVEIWDAAGKRLR